MATSTTTPEKRNYGIVVASLALWLTSTVINNLMKKQVVGMGPGQLNWPYPLFISTAHLNVEAFLSVAILYAFPKYRPEASQEFAKDEWKSWVVPSCLAGTADIAFNNYSLRYLDLGQVVQIRSITPIFVSITGWLVFGKQRPRTELLAVLGLVCVGVALMMSGSPTTDVGTTMAWFAKLCCLVGTVFGALRWNLVDEMLKHSGDNQIYVDFIMAGVMGVFMCVMSLFLEGWPQFLTGMDVGRILALSYGSGVFAFVFIVSSFVVMSNTSLLAFSISGVCVELTIIYFSHRMFGDRVSVWSLIGFALVVVSIVLFNLLRQ